MDLVSIIIPAYNHQKYVQEAVLSVIQQQYSNLELIVIDDGSTDDTWSILESMKDKCLKRFVRVEFWRQTNQGITQTLNRLFEAAQGKYVYRLDSDDMAAPEAIATLQEFLQGNPKYGLAVGDDQLIDKTGARVYWTQNRKLVKKIEDATFFTFGDFLKAMRPEIDFNSQDFGTYTSLLDGNYVPNGYLVRRHLMADIHFTTEAPREDHFMMLRLARTTKMQYMDKVLHSYRWHGGNAILKRKQSHSFARKTMKYELENLKLSDNPKWVALAEERLNQVRKKTKFKLGQAIELYKLSFVDRDQYQLRLGSKCFILKTEY